jgi:uncharacterized phiE125 gp8 family phage protein
LSGNPGWAWGWNYPLIGDPARSIWAPPRSRLVCTRRPDRQPITREQAILHLRLDPDTATTGPEVVLIDMLIATATQALEDYAGVALMSQEWRLTMRHLPPVWGDALDIPLPPLDELLKVTINEVDQDLDEFEIERDDKRPARLYPTRRYWPAVSPRKQAAVIIEFRCGVTNPTDVSPALRQALLMAIAFWYEQRESTAAFSLTPVLELGWQSLISPYRAVGIA